MVNRTLGIRSGGAALLLAALSTGCVGKVGGSSGSGSTQSGGSSGASVGGVAGGSSMPTGAGGTPGSGTPMSAQDPLQCARTGPAPGEAPLRRLTNQQFRNTLSAVFDGLAQVPNVDLPNEVLVAGFSNAASGQTSTLALLEGYQAAALAIANQVVAGDALNKLAPCPSTDAPHACGDKFVTSFGAKAFRRPLETGEHDRLLALFDKQQAAYGYSAAVRDTLEATLLSPQFAFRIEYGDPMANASGPAPLTPYEVATRVSYFLTDFPPDAPLQAAAQGGALSTVPAIDTQARRLLADPRAATVVAKFHEEWLRLSKLDTINKSATAFPTFSPALGTSMASATRQYVSNAFWNGHTVNFLLTDQHAFVDATLAPLYGVSAPAAMTLMDVSAQPRAGLLTQVGLMSALAKSATDDPIHRGLFVLSYLLCASPPPPPPNVPALQDAPVGDPHTTREHVELTHSPPACAACHTQIDGIGFGFENYDAIGQYRTKENGFAVDATGSFNRTQDIDGPFNGVVEMAKKLGSSKQVEQCVANQWFNFAFGKAATSADSCALKPVADAMHASHGDMKELLISLATSDAFRYLERQSGASQ